MAVKGVFFSDANIEGTKRGDFASEIMQIDPTGRAPLLALSSGMPSKGSSDIIVTWFEENHITGRAQVTSGGNSAATSITVDDASSYFPGVTLQVQDTTEYLLIQGVSGNVLTVLRGYGGTTAATIGASTTFVQRIGNIFPENSQRPTAVANKGYPRFNYMQIFRNAWNVSGTAMAIDYLTGDIVAKNRRDAAMFHAEDIERSYWYGVQSVGEIDGQPYRTFDGILRQISTNDVAAGGTTDWSDMDSFLQDVFSKNIKGKPNERISFSGNGALSVLNQIARLNSTTNIYPGETEFGMAVQKWITPYGTISVMTHPLFTENPVWTKDLHVLHPGAVEIRNLRPTHHDEYDADGKRAGVDGDYGVFTTECCITYAAEKTAGSFTGLTAGAADS